MPTDHLDTLPVSAADRISELTVPGIVVVVERGADEGEHADLNGASLCIGSGAGCDLKLTDRTVSRRHVMLTVTPHGILAEDLESRNGTLLNGARIRSAYVPDGALLVLGDTHLRVRAAVGRYVVEPARETEFEGLLGRSAAMRRVFALIRQLARTDLPVAVTGETGCGKELVARALHRAGPRRDKPFIVLDCGSILKDLLRSELFGHERGAFTGAEQTHKGILESARGGTVCLDEVGEIDPSVQPQLLRALETREVVRMGGHAPVPVDFRIVSATNRDLAAMSSAGTFRQDLYYRLSCVRIQLPPLRERLEDLATLAEHFLDACARRQSIPRPELSAGALKALEEHAWPGNVRELRNVMDGLCVMVSGLAIQAADVRESLAYVRPAVAPVASAPPARSDATLDEIERAAIERALAEAGWNRVQAARKLGISRSTLQDRIRKYGLTPPG